MTKISKIQKISLSTVLITLLSGCGGGGSSSSTQDNSGNVTKKAYEYDSCVDLNANLICEKNEEGLNPSDYSDTAVVSKDGKYLLAPSGSSKVTPWTTLVYNEMKYNPTVENSSSKAETYLLEKLNIKGNKSLDSSPLSDDLSKKLEDSIKTAIETNPNANKSSIIAAVCEKFITSKSDVTINVDDINKQHIILNKIDTLKIDEKNWENKVNQDVIGEIRDITDQQLVDSQGGEKIVSLKGKGNYLIAGSQYHNALTIINYNDTSKELLYNKFAAFRVNYENGATGGTAIPAATSTGGAAGGSTGGGASSGGSGVSGKSVKSQSTKVTYAVSNDESNYTVNTDPENSKKLWEHLLEDAQITADGKYVYTLIRSKDESVKYDNEETMGLFRVDVGPYGVYQYNSPSTIRIDARDITKFELSPDDETIVLYGQVVNNKDEKMNLLRVYDKNLGFKKAIELDSVKDFTITDDNKYIIVQLEGDYLNKPKLIKYSLNTLEKINETILDFEAISLNTYALGTMAVLINSSKLELINLETMKKEKEISFDMEIKLTSLSQDGKYLALASEDKIEVYNFRAPSLPKIDTINVDIKNIKSGEKYKDEKNSINHLSFIGNSILSYSQKQKQNAVVSFEIKDTKIAMTADNKLDLALETLDKYSVNNGYDFNKIANNLTLNKTYEDVNFIWTSTNLQSNIDLNSGKVTRDANQDVSGKLIVNAQITYRGETLSKEKTFNATVLKDINRVSNNIETMNILDTKTTAGLQRKIISNSDASTVVSYSELDDTFRGYNLFKTDGNSLTFTDGNENNTNRLLRDELLNMTFKTDEKLIIVTVNKHYPAFSSIYQQDIQANNTLEEGLNTIITNSASIGNYGTPLSAGFSGDKSKVIVIRKHFDFDYSDFYADIYAISGANITKQKSVKLQPGFDYINTKAPAVNDAGTVFYQISKNTIHKQDNSTHTSIRLDDVNAVYYFDNRVYASTTNGLIVSYDSNLSEASKQEFNLGTEGNINELSFASNAQGKFVYAFAAGTNAGTYIIEVNNSNEMNGLKYMKKENKGGTVSSDGLNIFTYENPSYTYLANTKSNISYSKKD